MEIRTLVAIISLGIFALSYPHFLDVMIGVLSMFYTVLTGLPLWFWALVILSGIAGKEAYA